MREAVERERDAAALSVAALERAFDDIAESVESANTDDEHDPEGATLAFERAQVVSLLEAAHRRLDALARARARIDDGSFDTCERCRGHIAVERLMALPDTNRCVDCARSSARHH